MVTEVFILSKDATVHEAVSLMSEKRVSSALIGSKEKPLGIFTERDAVRFVAKGKSAIDEKIKDHMTSGIISVDEKMTFEEGIHLMIEKKIRHLPVISKNKVVGIVSGNDLMKLRYELLAEVFHNTRRELDKTIKLLKKDSNQRMKTILHEFEKMQTQAFTDSMTSLYNRRYFENRLSEEIHRSDRYGYPVSLIFLDVDDFKYYNDKNGHQKGDYVLEGIGKILKQFNESEEHHNEKLRRSDIVARYGGEEFVVILPYTDYKEALAVAERIRKKIKERVFEFEKEQPQGDLTISAGVASYPDMAKTEKELVAFSDKALYLAKKQGKNQVCCYLTAVNSKK